MNGALALALRADCRARWRSMVVLGLVVTLASAAVLTPALMARRTSSAFDRQLRSVDAADVLISGPDRPATAVSVTPLASLAGVPGVLAEQRYVGILTFFPEVPWLTAEQLIRPDSAVSGPEPASFSLLDPPAASSPTTPPGERPLLSSGRLPRWDRYDELLVSPGLAHAAGWRVGSNVDMEVVTRAMPSADLLAPGREDEAIEQFRNLLVRRRMVVVGIGTLADGDRSQSSDSVIATPAFLAATDPAAQYSVHGVQLAAGATPGSVVAAAAAAGRGAFSVFQERAELADAYQDSVRPQATTLWVFAAVTGLVAVVVVGHALGREARSADGDVATRCALGMTRAHVALVAAGRVVAIAVVGVAVSIPWSVMLSGRLLGDVARAAEPPGGRGPDWATVVVIGSVSALALVALSVPAVVGLARARPPRPERRSRLAARTARAGAPVPVVLGARHAFEAGGERSAVPVRTGVVVAVTAVAVASAAGAFAGSLHRLVSTPRAYGVTWDVQAEAGFDPQRDCDEGSVCSAVTVLQERFAAIADFLDADPTVRGATPYASTTATLDGAALPVIGVGEGGVTPVVVDGARPRAGEIALGPAELRDRKLRVGDLVSVADGEPLRVVGTGLLPQTDEENRMSLGRGGLVAYETALGLRPSPVHRGFLIDLADDGDVDAFLDRFRATFAAPVDAFDVQPGAEPITIGDYRRVVGTPVVLAGVLAALALATMALAMASSLHRRAREFAVLRALGVSGGQVVASVAAQALLFSAAVLAVAVPLGLVVGRSVWNALERHLGTVSGVSWPVAPLAVSAAAGALALGLALARPCAGLLHTGVARQLAGE